MRSRLRIVALLTVVTAEAAVADSPAIEEVVVTAQRRAQNLQEVPISVSAFDQSMIEQREIHNVGDIQYSTPGFVYSQQYGLAQPTIRGIGSDINGLSGEPGVALYVDDVYLGRTFLPQAALVQIERIEVLRGPQGTLYGRNTSGGAVKFVSKRPSEEFEASAGLQYGSHRQLLGEASVSGAVVENALRARFSVFAEDRDGWLENLANGETLEAHEVLSARLAADWDAFDWLGFSVNADTTRQDDTGPVPQPGTTVTGTAIGESVALPVLAPFDVAIADAERRFGVVLDPLRERVAAEAATGRRSGDPREVYNDFPTETEIESDGVALEADAELGSFDATVVAAYRESSLLSLLDLDGSDTPLLTLNPRLSEAEQTSVELRLSSERDLPWGVGSVRALAGGFFYDEHASELFVLDVLPLGLEGIERFGDAIPPVLVPVFQNGALANLFFDTDQHTRSYAAFGEVEWDPFSWVTLRFGGRLTEDAKSVVNTIRAQENCEDLHLSHRWRAFTSRAGVDLRIDDLRMVYGSFSQGFKAGGFNGATCEDAPYAPELVDAFELGTKSQWFDDRVRLNAAVFRHSFDDIQILKIVDARSVIVNATSASIEGAEVEIAATPFWNVTVDGTASWLDARFEEFVDDNPATLLEGPVNLEGNRLTKSPEWSGSVGVEAQVPLGSLGTATPRLQWAYVGRYFFDQYNQDLTEQKAYQLSDAFVTFETTTGRFGVRGFVKNLTDEVYLSGATVPSAVVGGPLVFRAPPRTWGAQVYAKF